MTWIEGILISFSINPLKLLECMETSSAFNGGYVALLAWPGIFYQVLKPLEVTHQSTIWIPLSVVPNGTPPFPIPSFPSTLSWPSPNPLWRLYSIRAHPLLWMLLPAEAFLPLMLSWHLRKLACCNLTCLPPNFIVQLKPDHLCPTMRCKLLLLTLVFQYQLQRCLKSCWCFLLESIRQELVLPLSVNLLKSMIKHFFSSVYFNKYAFLHLILLITFDRVKISYQLIKSFLVIYILYTLEKIYLQSWISGHIHHTLCIFSTFLPYRPSFLHYQGNLILETAQYNHYQTWLDSVAH